jgi:hypothetical protein
MKGKKHLTGSFLNGESMSPPTQEPLLPVSQLEPNLAEIKKAEDVLQPRVVFRDGKKKPAPKPYVKPRTTRQLYRLSRRDIVALLDKPKVSEGLPSWMCKQYRALAARNITLDKLAEKHRISAVAMEAIVEGWESDIVSKTREIYQKFNPRGTEADDIQDEKTENETESAQDSDVLKSGGVSIGGRIISRGFNEKKGRIGPWTRSNAPGASMVQRVPSRTTIGLAAM